MYIYIYQAVSPGVLYLYAKTNCENPENFDIRQDYHDYLITV